jgi:hypothetical protein
MADNVPITAGSGTSIAADDVSSVYYQRIKLVTSEDGSSEPFGDLDHGSTRSLYVHPRPDTVIPSAPVNSAGLTTASTAYSAGDTLGTGWTIPNAAKASAGTGRVVGIDLRDYADVTSSISLWFFQGSVTFGTDNAAPSLSDADSLKYVGDITIAMVDLGSVRVGSANSVSIPYVLDGTDLLVYATTNTGHTFFGAVTDLRLRVHLTRD